MRDYRGAARRRKRLCGSGHYPRNRSWGVSHAHQESRAIHKAAACPLAQSRSTAVLRRSILQAPRGLPPRVTAIPERESQRGLPAGNIPPSSLLSALRAQSSSEFSQANLIPQGGTRPRFLLLKSQGVFRLDAIAQAASSGDFSRTNTALTVHITIFSGDTRIRPSDARRSCTGCLRIRRSDTENRGYGYWDAAYSSLNAKIHRSSTRRSPPLPPSIL